MTLKGAAAKAGLALSAALASLVVAELGLALMGFRPSWGYASRWADDDLEARYRLRPGARTDEFAFPARINSLGARGPEPARPLILSLGDSCTFGVGVREAETYAGVLTARGYETVNAGVPGYNSYSGLRRLRGSGLLALHPRLVTIYFGWNDHWRALATESAFARLRSAARWSRVASRLLVLESCLWSNSPRWKPWRWVPEVPLGQFKDDLRSMVDESRRAGADVVLITAPSSPELVEGNNFFVSHSLAELADHPRYAQAVRAVAYERGCGLVDLDREIARRAPRDPREYFFDLVHLNAKGHRLLADLLTPFARRAKGG